MPKLTVVGFNRNSTQTMSIQKVVQKHTKQSIIETERTEMSSIFTSIVCALDGGATTWQTIYTMLQNENPELRDIQPAADITEP